MLSNVNIFYTEYNAENDAWVIQKLCHETVCPAECTLSYKAAQNEKQEAALRTDPWKSFISAHYLEAFLLLRGK